MLQVEVSERSCGLQSAFYVAVVCVLYAFVHVGFARKLLLESLLLGGLAGIESFIQFYGVISAQDHTLTVASIAHNDELWGQDGSQGTGAYTLVLHFLYIFLENGLEPGLQLVIAFLQCLGKSFLNRSSTPQIGLNPGIHDPGNIACNIVGLPIIPTIVHKDRPHGHQKPRQQLP